MKIRRWHAFIATTCLISGIMLSWQYGAQARARVLAASGRNVSLVSVIQDMEKETAGLEERITTLRKQMEKAQQGQTDGGSELAILRRDLRSLNQLAGLTEVTGPGIRVELDDNVAGAAAAKNRPDYNPENYLIHDKNVLYLVYEIKRAGAEAIAVNGQRIVASSSVRCVGPVIYINSTRIAPTYVIEAVGNSDYLEQAVSNGEEFTYLKYKEYPVKIVKEASLTIPLYRGSYVLNHAKPAGEGGS